MTLATDIGTAIGTTVAYIVHYSTQVRKVTTPIDIASLAYTYRKDIQRIAVNHALDKSSPDAVQDNLFECLQYID